MSSVMKRLMSVLLVLVMCVSLVPVEVFADDGTEEPFTVEEIEAVEVPEEEEKTEAQEEEKPKQSPEAEAVQIPEDAEDMELSLTTGSGTCGDNLTWTLTDDGTLTISGTGPMSDFNSASYPWDNNSVVSVVISPGVTTIGGEAFKYCSHITSVVIPEGITSIGFEAFLHCSALQTLSIPSSVTSIGMMAFSYCTALTGISVDSGNQSFSSSDGVLFDKLKTELLCYPAGKSGKSYVIPSSVAYVKDSAFRGNVNLENITIPDSISVMDENAFDGCRGLTGITIPDSVNYIPHMAFYYCTNLATVVIPNSVRSIGSYAFHSCGNLTDVYFTGSEAGWKALTISDGNECLTRAHIHFMVDGSSWAGSITVMENTKDPKDPEDIKEGFVRSSNATVEYSGTCKKVSSSGTVEVEVPKDESVTISSPGYVSRTISVAKLEQNSTVYLQKESEYPVISALWLSSGDGRKVDVLHSDYVFSDEGETFTLTPEISWPADGTHSLRLTQVNGTTVSLNPTSSTFVKPADHFDFTKSITLIAEKTGGSGSDRESRKTVNLYAEEYYHTIPEWISGFNFKFADSLSLTLPKWTGPLEGTTFSTEIYSPVPVEIQVDGDTWYAAIGYEKGAEREDGKWTPKSFAESVKDLKGKLNKLSDAKKKYSELNEARKNMKNVLAAAKGKWGVDANFTVMAYAEGTFNKDGTIIVTSSGGFVLFEASAEYTQQCLLWVIPWYWEVGFSGSLQAQFNAIFAHPFAAKTFTTEVELKASLGVNIGAGVGLAKILSVGGGFKGSLDADWKLHYFTTKYFQLKGTIAGYFKANALWLSYNYPFDPFVDKTIYEYWGNEESPGPAAGGEAAASLSGEADAGPEDEFTLTEENGFFDYDPEASLAEAPAESEAVQTSAMLSEIYNTANYRPDDLSYLSRGSTFVPSELTASLASGVRATESSSFVTNAYAEADPQVASFSDGRKIAVWIGSGSNGVSFDDLQLYYSYYDGSWSEPQVVDSDGTADAYPEIEIIDGTAYLVWTDFSESIGAEPTLDSIAGKAGMSAAVFDADTCTFNVAPLTTGSGSMNVDPVLCGSGSSVYAVWLRNGDNDWFGRNGGNQLMYSSYSGSTWSEPSALAGGLGPVIDFDASCSGGSLSTVYSVDTDGDLTTSDDIEVFGNGTQLTENEVPDSGVALSGGRRYWLSGGEIVEDGVSITPEDYVFGTDRFQIVNGSIIVFTQPDGLCSTLYAMYRNGGGWGEPIALTDGSSCIRYFCATANPDGSLTVLMEKQAVVGDGTTKDDPFGTSEIVWFNAPSVCDITLNSVVYEHSDYDQNDTLKLELNITNNSNVDVNGLDITVKCQDYEQPSVFETDTVIKSGKTVDVVIELPVATVYQDRQITVTALPKVLNDAYPDDNTGTAVLNRNNLAVREMMFARTDLGSLLVSANIVNEGYSAAEDVKVSLVYGNEGAEPVETVTLGRLERLSGKAVSFRLSDPANGAYYIIVSSDIEEDYYGDNSCLAVLNRQLLDSISIEQKNIVIRVGDSETLKCVCEPAALSNKVVWTVENADEGDTTEIISIEQNGRVTAQNIGTAYAVAGIEIEGVTYTARCRVDVAANESTPIQSVVTDVSLVDSKATVELYSTNYTALNILLERELIASLTDGEEPADNGSAVESAFFTGSDGTADAVLNSLFRLRVKDDRTLEIIPDETNAVENPGAVAGSYKSNITVVVDGKSYDAGLMTLTVKKTMPKVKAAALKFNTLIPGQTLNMVFAGGKVSSVLVDAEASAANAKSDASSWLTVSPDGAVQLKDGVTGKKSGKLYLTLTVDGFAVKQKATVSVSANANAPKLSFKPSSVTLKPGTGDTASLAYTIGNYEFAGTVPSVSRITEGAVTYANGDIVQCDVGSGAVRVSMANTPQDGKAHTYKVFLSVSGVEYSFTVKTLADTAKISITSKATGFIDTAIKNSPIVVSTTLKNYHAGNGEKLSVKVLNSSYDSDVTDYFDVIQSGTSFTLRAKAPRSLNKKYTYSAVVSAEINGTVYEAKPVKLNIRYSAPEKVAPSFTLKAKGSIDVVRPGTSVTLTPVFKNCYEYELVADDLTFYTGSGKTLEVLDNAPFNVEVRNGQYVITAREGCSSAEKYSVVSELTLYGTTCVSKAVKLNVKMGSAKGTADKKAVTLLKKDRYSSESVKITLNDRSLTRIASVLPDEKSSALFDVRSLGGGEYEIRWKGNQVTTQKTSTVKLNVFLEGNLTAKPNFTVSVKVNVK